VKGATSSIFVWTMLFINSLFDEQRAFPVEKFSLRAGNYLYSPKDLSCFFYPEELQSAPVKGNCSGLNPFNYFLKKEIVEEF